MYGKLFSDVTLGNASHSFLSSESKIAMNNSYPVAALGSIHTCDLLGVNYCVA